MPGEVVGRDDAGGAAALGFEREEAVPGADVEHAQTGERLWKIQPREPDRAVVDPFGDDAAAEIDRVIPANHLNL